MNIIILIIILTLCLVGLIAFKTMEKKKHVHPNDEDKVNEEQKTAQDFINVKDIVNNCLYTNDDMIFAFVKIEGLCIELYSKIELKNLCHKCSTQLAKIKNPFKYISVSRPVDVSKALDDYWGLYEVSEGGRRHLLKEDMRNLTEMVVSGETLERQHYIIIWNNVNKEHEKDITKRAIDLAKIFCENGIKAEMIEKKSIVKLLNLVNIPAYVHIETTTDIDSTMTLLKD